MPEKDRLNNGDRKQAIESLMTSTHPTKALGSQDHDFEGESEAG